MNKLAITTLKSLRKLSQIFSNHQPELRNRNMYSLKEYANDLIYNTLIKSDPCMIARFGSTEMLAITNYLGVKSNSKKSAREFIKGERYPWWWEKSTLEQLHKWSGFFPSETKMVEQFCELMINDSEDVDLLGSWLNDEKVLIKPLQKAKRVVLEDLEPFFSKRPWTNALEGKTVLVVHPFSETIEAQYKKRAVLFENNLLPDFDLKTVKAVQSIAGQGTEFDNWFQALDFMKSKIDAVNYDICILGCGAYGFPLAAHIKRDGKKAIHLGGATQLLFGIKGRRWVENPILYYPYINLFNEHWVYPDESEKPKNAQMVEGACYW